jgi:hypothetical protein
MALSVAEIESVTTDLEHQYESLSREASETQNSERKAEVSDMLMSIDYHLARLEEQRLELLNQLRSRRSRAAGAGI